MVVHNTRTSGSSGYSFSKLLALALNLFTNFSLIPLQFVSALGIIGEDLGRLHLNVNSKPQYTERIVLTKDSRVSKESKKPQ